LRVIRPIESLPLEKNGGVKGMEVEDGEERSSFLLVSKSRATKWRGNPSSWQ